MHVGLSRIGKPYRFGSVYGPGEAFEEIPVPRTARIGNETVTPSQPQQPPPSNTLEAVMPMLTATAPVSMRLKKLKAEILAEAGELLPQWDAFLEACVEERQASLTKQHSDIRAAGRKQQSLCERLNGEFLAATTTWNRATEAKARAMDALQRARWQREHLSRMASDEEIAEAAGIVERHKDKVRLAVQAEAEAIGERNAAEDKLFAARGELAAIMQTEYRIKAELDGEPYRDPELGLDVPA